VEALFQVAGADQDGAGRAAGMAGQGQATDLALLARLSLLPVTFEGTGQGRAERPQVIQFWQALQPDARL